MVMKKKRVTRRANRNVPVPADAKDVEAVRKELAAQRRLIHNLDKNNKYLKDRVSYLENRGSALERIVNQLQTTVDSISRVFRR